MRAGARRNEWTSTDVRYLLDNAGRIPKREICRRLRRSAKSVESMAYHLRRQGYSIDLRYYEPRAIICC